MFCLLKEVTCPKLKRLWAPHLQAITDWSDPAAIAKLLDWLATDAGLQDKLTDTEALVREAIQTAQAQQQLPEFVDGIHRRGGTKPITIGITYWQRPASLLKLLASIEQYAPDYPLVIVDTGGNLSAARNRLAAECQHGYIFLCEEDMEFTAATDIEACAEILDSDQQIDGVGGICLEQAKGKARWGHDFVTLGEHAYITPSTRPLRSTPTGRQYRPCDLVLNMGLFRRSLWQQVRWDEQIPITEHREYYYRASLLGHEFAFYASLEVRHHKDRPGGDYNRQRLRSFEHLATRKHGVSFLPDNGKLPAVSGEAALPNLVVIGTGSSNSTVTMRQLEALGWNVGDDCDRQFMEHRTLRSINERVRQKGDAAFDRAAAERLLRNLPTPWALKDPRLCETWPHWWPLLRPHKPWLLWVDKDLDYVIDSYRRHWQLPAELARRRYFACEQQYRRYDGPKLRIAAERIAAAVSLYDLTRTPAV